MRRAWEPRPTGRARGVLAALLLAALLALSVPARSALSAELSTTKLVVGEVRDFIRTSTQSGVALDRESVTTDTGPYSYLEGASNVAMRPCEEVCADKLMPGGGIAPPSLSADLIAQGIQPCTIPCYYARTMLRAPASGDLFQQGIESDDSFGQGRFTQAPYGLFTMNFVTQHMYVYTPPRGRMPDVDCAAKGLLAGCAYEPGDVNPYGLRKIDMSSGKHLGPPTIQYAPLQMEYDLLSKSLLVLTSKYPATNPPTVKVTVTSTVDPAQSYEVTKPILSLIALDEATGKVVTPTEIGPDISGGPYYTVTFCKSCPYKPDPTQSQGFEFLFDYTDTYSSSSTFDQVDQVFWTVLWNPEFPDSPTLFGVRRYTDFEVSATDPLNGKWSLRVDYAKMQYYAWPKELLSLSNLEFSPVMTQQVTDSEGVSSYIKFDDPGNVKALVTMVTMTDKVGPCAPAGAPGGKGLRCGYELSADDVAAHNGYAADSLRGALVYDPASPVYCLCPTALIQLNINYQGAVATAGALMTLGNSVLDSTGQTYKILKWLDGNFDAADTWNNVDGLSSAQKEDLPSASSVPFLSALMAMQPSSTGSTADETPSRFFLPNYDMRANAAAVPPLPPPRPQTAAEPLVPGTETPESRTPYGIWEFTLGTDLTRDTVAEAVNNFTAVAGQQRPPLFMFSEDQYSKVIQSRVANMFVVATSPQRSFLTGKQNGILASELICTKFPLPCENTPDSCKTREQNLLEDIIGRTLEGDSDFLATWNALYSAGSFTKELWVQDPQKFDRRGNALPRTWSFQCPETCDFYPCDQCEIPCKLYVTAGQRTSLQITAVTIFGSVSVSRNDNFTASIQSPDWIAEGAANVGGLPSGQYVLGPTFRQAFQLDADGKPFGERLPGGDVTPVGQVTPDPLVAKWVYPNYHNLGVASTTAPPYSWMRKGEVLDPSCAATPLMPEGRCLRSLTRPRILGDGGGVYLVSFGLDRAGEYELQVGFRGQADPYDGAGDPVNGTGIKGSPFTLTVIAGTVDHRLTEAVNVPACSTCVPPTPALTFLEEGTVGEEGEFYIQPRDKYGNNIETQVSFVLEASFRGVEYVTASTNPTTVLPTAASVPKDSLGRPTKSYSEIASVGGTGYKKIRYHLTKRSRVDPVYQIVATVNNRPIAGPGGPRQTEADTAALPYKLTLRPAPTSGSQSFAVESKSSDAGLGVSGDVVAGFDATFAIRARDRFANSQGFPDGTTYAAALVGGFVEDPFMVVVEDAEGNCGVGVVGQVWNAVGAAWGVRNQAGTKDCWSVEQLDANPWTVDGVPPPPAVTVTRGTATTHLDGLYNVSYNAKKAGVAKLTAYLCDVDALALGTCGSSAAPGKPAGSSQPDVFGESIGPTPQGGNGVAVWPAELTVLAGPTDPATSIVSGTGVDTFVAGSRGAQLTGEEFIVTVRDQYGNVKTNVEADLLQPGNMPAMTVKYQTECSADVAGHATKACEGIYQRDVEGVTVSEVPLRLSGNTVYQSGESVVDITVDTVYLGASDPDSRGKFRTRFVTDLAGRMDIRIDIPKGRTDGTLESTRYPITGANGTKGFATFLPYREPYPLVVKPAEFSGAFSEVFFFEPPAIPVGGRTATNSKVYSSHAGLSHQFQSTNGIPVLGMTGKGIVGRAGSTGTFYVQMRDKYANVKTDAAPADAFNSLNISAFDPATLESTTLLSACTPGAAPVSLTAQTGGSGPNGGNQGLFGVTYCTQKALQYTVTIKNAANQELTRMVSSLASGGLTATANRFKLTVRPASPDAEYFTAVGPGLRGATLESHPNVVANPDLLSTGEITVTARDQYGNRSDATLAEAQQIAGKLHLILTRCPSADPSTNACDAATRTVSSPTSSVDGTTFKMTVWEPVTGQAGLFRIVWTPKNVNGGSAYYAKIEIKYGNESESNVASKIIGSLSSAPTDWLHEDGVPLNFTENAGLSNTFPKQVIAYCHDGDSTLQANYSVLTGWNGVDLYTAYAGSTCGEQQTVIVTPISDKKFAIKNKAGVGSLEVKLYRPESPTNASVSGASPFAGQSAAQITALLAGWTPALTLSRTFDAVTGANAPNATPSLINYLSDGTIEVKIPAKTDLLDTASSGVYLEGYYAVVVAMRAHSSDVPLVSISRMPFGGLRFAPAATGVQYTQVLHYDAVGANAKPVDPSNASGDADTALYDDSDGAKVYKVTAGDAIKFILRPRDDFNNAQVYGALKGPDDIAVSVSDAPPAAQPSTVTVTAETDNTYTLEVGQTAAGRYNLRFWTSSDITQQSAFTKVQGAYELVGGAISRGLLGTPSPGASASDYQLPLLIVPGPAAVEKFQATWNKDKMSVGDLQDVTVVEYDAFENRRATVTEVGGAVEYLDVSFKWLQSVGPPAVLSVDTEYNYTIPKGTTVDVPQSKVTGASEDYKNVGYKLDPGAAEHTFTHIVGHGATEPGTADVFKAGNFQMEVTKGGVHIAGSPFFMRFDTRSDGAAFDIKNSFAYGPGVSISGFANVKPDASDPPAGTVRKGDEAYFWIQLRDSYSNELTRRPAGDVDIRMQIFQPSNTDGTLSDPTQDLQCAEELVTIDGTEYYQGKYKCAAVYCRCDSKPCTSTCYKYQVIRVSAAGQGFLPATKFYYYDDFNYDPDGTKLPATIQTGAVASNLMSFSYPDASGTVYTIDDGAVVLLLSGLASIEDSFTDDPDCNVEFKASATCASRVTGGTNWGNMTAGENYKFRVRMLDSFQQPKTDVDAGSSVVARLYMMKDSFGQSLDIKPWLDSETEPKNGDGSSVWNKVAHPSGIQGTYYMRDIKLTNPPNEKGELLVHPDEYGYTSGGFPLPRAGIYELHVKYVVGTQGAPDYKETHLSTGTRLSSPYFLDCQPGNSDPNSAPKQTDSTATTQSFTAAIQPQSFRRSLMSAWAQANADPGHPRHGMHVSPYPEPENHRLLMFEEGHILGDVPVGDIAVRRLLRRKAAERDAALAASDTAGHLATGSRNAAGLSRRTLMADDPGGAPAFEIPAGANFPLNLELKDSIGNEQAFTPLKPLDTALIEIADFVRPASNGNAEEVPCKWVDPVREGLPKTVDPESPSDCRLVHTGFNFLDTDLCKTTKCPPDLSPTGLNLKQINDIKTGTLRMEFSINETLPAVFGKTYLLSIQLNGVSIANSPFDLQIKPGAVHGPACEVTKWDLSGEEFLAGQPNQFVFQARDRFGNNQFTNAEQSNFLIDMFVKRETAQGTRQIVRGCTPNANSASACFSVKVGPYNADPEARGQYAVTFTSLVSSAINLSGKQEDFSMSIRYCPDAKKCSSRDNFYNPAGLSVAGNYGPIVVKVLPGATFAGESVAFGPDLKEGGVIGRMAAFTIEARDRFANRRLVGGDLFEAIVYAPRRTVKISIGVVGSDGGTIKDNGNGTYDANFFPADPGTHTTLVQISRKDGDTTTPQGNFGFIRDSPFAPEFRLSDGPINAIVSRVVDAVGAPVTALSSTTAGEDKTFVVQTYTITDSTKNLPKKDGGDLVVAELIVGSASSGGIKYNLAVTDHRDNPALPTLTGGRYSVLVPGDRIQSAQEYAISIKACQAADPAATIGSRSCAAGKTLTDIRGSPFIFLVEAGPMVPEKSFAVELADPDLYVNDGKGWQAGLISTFTVQPRDQFNNNGRFDPLTSTEIAFELSANIKGVSTQTTWQRVSNNDVSSLNDGEYMVTTTFEGLYVFSFMAHRAQQVTIDVRQGDLILRNTPAIAVVKPGPVDVSNCIIDRTVGTSEVGQAGTFVIISRDSFANNLPAGGVDFEVVLALDAAFTEPGDGDNPMTAQSRASESVLVPAAADALVTTDTAARNKNATFTYSGRGINDPSFSVNMNLYVRDLLNGKYSVYYYSEASGAASLSVKATVPAADGTLITSNICTSATAAAWCSRLSTMLGGRFVMDFTPLAPTNDSRQMHSYIYSDFRHNEEITAGETAKMVIRAYDKYKNRVTTSGYQFTSTLTLGGNEQRRLLGGLRFVTCVGPDALGNCESGVPDKSYLIEYTPTTVGAYILDVKRSGASLRSLGGDGNFKLLPFGPVSGQPGFVVKPGPLDPDTSSITHAVAYVKNTRNEGKPHVALYAEAGVTQTFFVRGYDRFANAITTGGEQPIVQIGLLYEGKVTDNNNGTYNVEYTIFASNVYDMRVLINQEPLSRCESCRLESGQFDLDGEQATTRYYEPTLSAYELHVDVGAPVAKEFKAATGTISAVAGQSSSIDVKTFDGFGNVIVPSIGRWQCPSPRPDPKDTRSCIEDPSGSVLQTPVSVTLQVKRKDTDPNDSAKLIDVDFGSPIVGQQNLTDGTFRLTYGLEKTGAFELAFFGSVAGAAPVKFDSTEGDAAPGTPSVCPTTANATAVCDSHALSPEVTSSALDISKGLLTGTGLSSVDSCRLSGQTLSYTLTPRDGFENYVVSIIDGAFQTDVRLDTARTPLAGWLEAVSTSATSANAFISVIFSGGATAAGSADAEGDTSGVFQFPDPGNAAEVLAFQIANPGALLDNKRVQSEYTATAPGTMTVSVKYQGLHISGSPFQLLVSAAGDLSGVAAASNAVSGGQTHGHVCTPTPPATECTAVQPWVPASCGSSGTCSSGLLANHMVGSVARYEILPRDVFGNAFTDATLPCSTLASELRKCDGTLNTECPIRARASFGANSAGGAQKRSSYGASGAWEDDLGSLDTERPTVTWDAAEGLVIVRVPMYAKTTDGNSNVTVDFSLHTSEDSKLTVPGLGLALTRGEALTATVLDGAVADLSMDMVETTGRGDGLVGLYAGETAKYTIFSVASLCRTAAGAHDTAIPDEAACTAAGGGRTWVQVPNPKFEAVDVAIASVSDATDTITATVTHGADSTYEVTYTTQKALTYLSTVSISGARLPIFVGQVPTQGTIQAFAAMPSAAKSTVTVGAASFVAGKQAYLIANLFDEFDNPVVGQDFQLQTYGVQAKVAFVPGVTGPQALTAQQTALLNGSIISTDNGDGTFNILFNTRIAGKYSVEVFMFGPSTVDPATGRTVPVLLATNEITVVPGPPSATATTLTGSSGGTVAAQLGAATADSSQTVKVVARDLHGNTLTTGGYLNDLELQVTSDGGFDTVAIISDNNDGTYNATFKPPTIGTYTLKLLVQTVLARQDSASEFTAQGTVITVPTDPTQVLVSGQGTSGSRVGQLARFSIIAKDKSGRDKVTSDDCETASSCKFKVTLTPKTKVNDYGVELPTVPLPVAKDLDTPGRFKVEYQLANFGSYELSVTLGGTEVNGSPFQVEIAKEVPPTPGFAVFSNTATSLVVRFFGTDRKSLVATNRGGLIGLDACSKIFTPTSVVLFGEGASCSFRTPSEVAVYLGFRATVKPTDILELSTAFSPTTPGIINQTLTSGRSTGSITVSFPTVAPRPTLVLKAPRFISKCDSLVIDASGSYGASGRDLKFSWGMMPNVPNERQISTILQTATEAGNVNRVEIANELLAQDLTYTFFVEVRNFLDTFSQQSLQVTRKSSPIPRLTIEGDPVIRVFRSADLYIPVTVSVPSDGTQDCVLDLTGQKISFTWSFDTSQSTRSTFPLDPATKNSRILYIPPNTLSAGSTYYLKVVGVVEGRPELSAEGLAVVQVKYEPMVVELEMPTEITTKDDLSLSTARSFDPNDPAPPGAPTEAPFGPFLFAWSCNPVVNDVAIGTAGCFDDATGLLAPPPESFSINIPAGTLLPGTYQFTVTARKEPLAGPEGPLNRVVSISKRVTVLAPPSGPATATGSVPVKPIVALEPLGRNVVNASDKLVLRGNITVSYPNPAWTPAEKSTYFTERFSNIDWMWEVMEGVLDVSDFPDTVTTDFKSPILAVAPDKLAAGEKYKLRLTATDRESTLVGQDSVEFVVNGAPTSGTCSVDKTTGVAAQDKFSFLCSGWEDEQQEGLRYDIKYVDPTLKDAIPLVPLSRSNVMSELYLPPVTTATAKELEIRIRIIDFYGAATEVEEKLTVDPPTFSGLTQSLECTKEEDAKIGCPCTITAGAETCTTEFKDEKAFVLNLVSKQLALSEATNNVPSLITIAKSAAMITNAARDAEEKNIAAVQSKVTAGTALTAEESALWLAYNNGKKLSGILVTRMLTSVNKVGKTVQLSQEDLDMFGDAFRDLMKDESVLDTSAAASAIGLAVGRTGSVCVTPTGAQGVLDAMSAVDGAIDVQTTTVQTQATTQRRLAARRALLSGGDDAREHSRRWLQQEIAATAEVSAQLSGNFDNQNKLVTSMACNLTEGEAGFGFSTKNIQTSIEIKTDPNGEILPPAPGTVTSGATARRSLLEARDPARRKLMQTGQQPGFNVPTGTATQGVSLTVVAKNNQVNPFAFDKKAAAVAVASSVASLEFTNPDSPTGKPEEVKLKPEQPSIQIKIPVTVSGSACRRTVGGCRYYNETAGEWMTDGLYEVERTDTYILCEAKHLTSFAVSADDAVPAFNVVNPIGDADLLTNITLENSLVFWVVGIILLVFTGMIIAGHRQDKRDRDKARLEMQISKMERRINPLAENRKAEIAKQRKEGFGHIERTEVKQARGGANAASAAKGDEGYLSKMGAALMSNHEVIALMYTRPSDPFTRPQRLVVILALVLAQIAVIALFFGTDPSNLAAKAFIGLITAVAIAPSKYAFKLLFEKSTYVERKARAVKPPRTARRPHTRPVRWRIRVWTSDRRGAGTDATVSVHMYGLKGEYGPLVLPASREGFERGCMDEFQMVFPSMGDLHKISIGHDGRGIGAGWHLDKVEFVNLETAEAWLFKCGQWLDTNQRLDGGQITRFLELPERYHDDDVKEEREAEMRAIEEAARLARQADEEAKAARDNRVEGRLSRFGSHRSGRISRAGSLKSNPDGHRKGGPDARHAGAMAQAGIGKVHRASASGSSYMANASAFAGPTGRGNPAVPEGGVPRPKLRTIRPPGDDGAPTPPERPAAGLGMRPKRMKARTAALQALGLLRAGGDGPGAGVRPGGRAMQGEGARNLGTIAEGFDGEERKRKIRQLVGRGEDHDVGVDPMLVKAAKKIQRRWRRRMAIHRRKQLSAAIQIQASWRGFLARRQVKDDLERDGNAGIKAGNAWFLNAHRGRHHTGVDAKGGRGAPRVSGRLSRLQSRASMAGGRGASLHGAPSGMGNDPLLSLAVRDWVKDAPATSAREGEEVQKKILALQAGNAKVRELKRIQRRKLLRDRRLRRGLPRWFIWPTYVLCFLFILASIYMIILYGLSFPPAIARAWLLSSLFSVFVELFIQDPIRVLFVSYMKARVDELRNKAQLGINEEEDELDAILKAQQAQQKRGRARLKKKRGDDGAKEAGGDEGDDAA